MDLTYKSEDWPWVWALRETELLCLEWKDGLSMKDLEEIEKLQEMLPMEIIDKVWIGNQLCAQDVDRLVKLGITHVLNVGGRIQRGPTEKYKAKKIVYFELDAEDFEGYPLLEKHMTDAHGFIDLARKKKSGGNCLVYCEEGLDRSGSIVAAESMLHDGMNVLEAVAMLREKRGEYAISDENLQEQLVALARTAGLLGDKPGTETSLVKDDPPPAPEREEDDMAEKKTEADIRSSAKQPATVSGDEEYEEYEIEEVVDDTDFVEEELVEEEVEVVDDGEFVEEEVEDDDEDDVIVEEVVVDDDNVEYEIISPSGRRRPTKKIDVSYMWSWDPNNSSNAQSTAPASPTKQKSSSNDTAPGGDDLGYIRDWKPGDSPKQQQKFLPQKIGEEGAEQTEEEGGDKPNKPKGVLRKPKYST